MRKVLYLFALLALCAPLSSQAAGEANLFLSSRAGVWSSAKTFNTRIMVSANEAVNAAEGLIKFDPKALKVTKLNKEGSIFELWSKAPKFSNANGTIEFGGGMPGKKYKGSAGLLLSLEFQALKPGKHLISFDASSSKVLTADGKALNIAKDFGHGRPTFGNSAAIKDAQALTAKMSGRILLQVEDKGKAWYVSPTDKRRYFLGRPEDAFNLMRKLGLGTKHAYITKYQKGQFPAAVSGKILIDVEDSGKAYYINSKDNKAYYLGRPADAFRVMREQGLGISNDAIDKIDDWAV